MRIISVFTALAITWAGSISAQEPAKYILNDDPIYSEGINALADHLPAIATKKFAALLKSENLTDDTKLKLLFLLTESQVRSNKPTEALTTLSDPLIAEHPDALFWKGQALAGTGRYNDAIQTLEQTDPKSKNYQLGQLKIANLAAALNDIDKALTILNQSIKGNKNVSPQTYISLANLYLAKEDPENAAKMLAKIEPSDELVSKVKQLLQAQIDILLGNYQEAIKSLDELIQSPDKLNRKTLSFSTLYLADALHLSGQNQEAINTLTSYLDTHPSPLLGSMFARLGKWIPSDTPITDPAIKKLITWAGADQNQKLTNLSKKDDRHSDLSAFALYYYARYLAGQTEAASKTKAIFEFNRLRLRYPTHILAGTSLTDTATTQLSLGRIDAAQDTLKLIQRLNIPIAPIAKQQAGFLLGKLNLDEQNYPAAAAAYQTVVDSASGELRTASIVNAASSYLAAADTEGFIKLKQNIDDPAIQTNLTLEYALWLARENKIIARTILHNFTLMEPNHPRITEARLALALHCLRVSPVDLHLSQSIIPEISQVELLDNQQADYSYLIYRNAISHADYAGAADAARQFTETFPEHPRLAEFTLLQGQALYHNGQHNEARRILLNMVKTYPQHPLKSYAEYYAAMSAKLEGTPQSQEESIKLFSQIANSDSSLASESLLQLAQLYINKNQPQKAIQALKPVFDAQPIGKKSLNLGILLASAYHALGDIQPENFQSALDIFDILIKQNQGNFQALNEIKYNKALALQHMNNDDDALEIYYSVINIDLNKAPITEWKWYYKCGFTAIAMLEEMKNPNGAIAIAKKLSNSNGSRADEAAKRARSLEMKYMIWEY
ncbi:MAG: tetratricopeptide repeat protein [Akkermansiaceae bacterium]